MKQISELLFDKVRRIDRLRAGQVSLRPTRRIFAGEENTLE